MTEPVYLKLWEKFNDNAITAPKDENNNPHPAFLKHLELCYTPEEAQLLQHMGRPVSFMSTQDLADMADQPLETVEPLMEKIHKKNGVMGFNGFYTLPPMPFLLNRHHFYTQVEPDDVEAGQLYQEYFVKDGFHRFYEASKKGSATMRTIPVKVSIEPEQKVLTAEEAHDFILNHAPEEMALVPCPCRTRTEKLGIRECQDKFPVASCIFLGASALHMEMLGLGKRVSRQEAVAYFDEMQEKGLIGNTDNTISNSSVICMCCGCCCSQVRGRTRWDHMAAVMPSNFIPEAGEDCIGCELCIDRCLLDALSMDDETDRPKVEADKCIGCGVCTLTCPEETLKLVRYERSTPFNTSKELVKTLARENRE